MLQQFSPKIKQLHVLLKFLCVVKKKQFCLIGCAESISCVQHVGVDNLQRNASFIASKTHWCKSENWPAHTKL